MSGFSVIFLHPLAGSQHAAPKEHHCGGGCGSGQVHSRCPSRTELVDPCRPPDQSTHEGSSLPSFFTVSQVREAHNSSSWAGWRVAEKPPCCLVRGTGICRVGQGGPVGVPDVVSQGVSEGLQHLPWLQWQREKKKGKSMPGQGEECSFPNN